MFEGLKVWNVIVWTLKGFKLWKFNLCNVRKYLDLRPGAGLRPQAGSCRYRCRSLCKCVCIYIYIYIYIYMYPRHELCIRLYVRLVSHAAGNTNVLLRAVLWVYFRAVCVYLLLNIPLKSHQILPNLTNIQSLFFSPAMPLVTNMYYREFCSRVQLWIVLYICFWIFH